VITWHWRTWDTLSITELHDALQLRAAVFVVEQDCAYQDLDGLDSQCHHLLGLDEHGLAATIRAVPPGLSHAFPCIGRVVTAPRVRGTGLGRPLMREALRYVATVWPGPVHISAQAHLHGYYASLGFVTSGPGYDEDGIPHLPMDRIGHPTEVGDGCLD
jgi:ElaA protein